MWVALLNLENMYGSQESLTKVFERAVQYNEPLKVFLQLADIYTKSEKFQVGVWARWPAARGSPATQNLSPWGHGGSREESPCSGSCSSLKTSVCHWISRETLHLVRPPHFWEPTLPSSLGTCSLTLSS